MPTINIQTVAASSMAPMASASLFEMVGKPVVNAFNSALKPCPARCSDTGSSPSNWTVYHDTDRLAWCNETMLLDFAIYNALEDPKTHTTIRSCSADENTNVHEIRRRTGHDVSCVPAKNDLQVEASLQMAWLNSPSPPGNVVQLVAVAQQILSYLAQKDAGCNSTELFASSGPATIGIYTGSQMLAQGIATSVLQQFINQLQSTGISNSLLVQLCGADQRGADYALGIVANANGSLPFVQRVVKTWSDGKCVTAYDGASTWKNTTFWAPTPQSHESNFTWANGTSTSISTGTSAVAARQAPPPAPSLCSTVQVVAGDSCGSLATKCGITGAKFTQYNPASTLCSTLAVGQHVCCSAGALPNFAPKPNADGSCFSYLVVAGDYCAKIASTNSLTVAQLETLNKNTWGWTGCNNLQAGVNMCLSTGNPPMPAPVPNAVCGPQVVGTKPPPSGISLADLNPCPLNACCDIWGQCGTTDDFCSLTPSLTGAPGTAAPGTNGCISNCGTAIIIGSAPATFFKIAYFEGFNWNRPCLNMDITDLDTSQFTHVHLAFATITPSFDVDVSGIQDQFDRFVNLKGVKRILSFGGWSFSTDQDTYPIFRQGVTDANRNTFIANVVNFVKTHGIDGVDFDWEYPGAPDIPGIPPGNPNDGENYFIFLYYLKRALPSGVSLSIAAPASFWYLKGFPIYPMSVILDYIIYMTYDLHGQWDYGNKWSDPGCPGGNCLRSHINLTETINALSMITKAGVPSSKVIVGVTSYGRAFEMTTQGCVNEMCTYAGPASQATPGECTGTAGYIANAEIDDIISGGVNVFTYNDDSFSNILVYNSTQWVAYMDDNNKAQRTSLYKSYNLGGITDWAVDLGTSAIVDTTVTCFNTYATVDDILAATGISDDCMNVYLIQALGKMLNSALAQYKQIMTGDYDNKFNEYAKAVKDEAPVQMTNFYQNELDNYVTCVYSVYADGKYTNHSGPGCPPNNIPQQYQGYAWNIYMTPNDLETMYTYVETNYGVDRSWIIFGTLAYAPCIAGQDCSAFGSVYGIPDADPNLVVPNPKDIVSAALANLTALSDLLADVAVDASFDLFGGDAADVVDSSALPVYMVQNAVAAMQQVIDVAKQIEEEERKNLILTFITAVLFLLPIVGDALGALADFAILGRLLTMIGTIGNAAMGVYDVVENPSSAPLAIIGILLGGVFSRSSKAFEDAAKIRRGMTADQIAKLGGEVSAGLTKVGKVVKLCKI